MRGLVFISAIVWSANLAAIGAAAEPVGNRIATVEPGLPSPAPLHQTQSALPAEGTIAWSIRDRLQAPATGKSDADAADRSGLASFYETRAFEPIWVEASGLNLKARALVDELGRAGEWGLNPADFDTKPLTASDAGTGPTNGAAQTEIRLSQLALHYVRDARGGRIAEPAKMLSSYLDRTPPVQDRAATLAELATAEDPAQLLRSAHPRHPQFHRLREKLLALRAKGAGDLRVSVPSKGPKLKRGDTHAHVAIVRKRLGVSIPDVYGAPGLDGYYDTTLEAAVTAFQRTKHIKPADGVLTKETRNALNNVMAGSESKLLANMEQWRWMPDDLGDLHVAVNIPEFMVRVVKGGTVIHDERIVAGQVDKQTPVFSDEMKTVVFHPNWGVPESIKVNEILPGLAAGGGSFRRQGLEIRRNGRKVNPYSINWSRTDIRNYDVIQPPGRSNVLGVVKFLFPNKHATYMHDTPSKSLFNASERTFSHGCMRVRNPLRLAEVLLEADKGWDSARITDLIRTGPQNNEITLANRIPVHITYFTAWVDDTGTAHYSKDVYGHEKRIALALDGKMHLVAKGEDHLAPVQPKPIKPATRYAQSRNRYVSNDGWGWNGGYGYREPRGRQQRRARSTNEVMWNNMFGF